MPLVRDSLHFLLLIYELARKLTHLFPFFLSFKWGRFPPTPLFMAKCPGPCCFACGPCHLLLQVLAVYLFSLCLQALTVLQLLPNSIYTTSRQVSSILFTTLPQPSAPRPPPAIVPLCHHHCKLLASAPIILLKPAQAHQWPAPNPKDKIWLFT